jgi:FtsP/CotA-like multicopper oxidase with cupredoxin domain
MKRGGITRKRFLAGLAPLVAMVPLSKDQRDPGSHARMMEAFPEPSEPDAPLVPDGGKYDPDGLLFPPPAKGYSPGRVREYDLISYDRRIQLTSRVKFDAWTYNGTVPGPVIRVTEGDEVRVMFTNRGKHPHSIHFHGIHRGGMDGIGIARAGSSAIYEFSARPAGLHLYQCHAEPLAEHAARGLYGAFIIDPREGRAPAQELVMVLSGFDTNGDEANELYAINGRPFYYEKYPIVVERSKTVRIFLVNMTEYDAVNSFHLHGEFFRLYRTGTVKEPEYTDTVMLCQGERCVVEVDFHHSGVYMFHSHQSRLAENGCRGWFHVVEKGSPELAAAGPLGVYAEEFAECAPCRDELGAKAITIY